jgi:hypothetical protein
MDEAQNGQHEDHGDLDDSKNVVQQYSASPAEYMDRRANRQSHDSQTDYETFAVVVFIAV